MNTKIKEPCFLLNFMHLLVNHFAKISAQIKLKNVCSNEYYKKINLWCRVNVPVFGQLERLSDKSV